jgi:hypothetical protein
MIGLYRRPEGNNFTATLQTDPRQTLTGTIHTGLMNAARGMITFYSSLECIVRPNSWIELVPSLTLASTRSEESWPLFFYTTNGYNLFGDRDIDQYDFSLRGTITFTRAVSLQFFTQVFLAKGQYDNFKELVPSGELVPYTHDKAAANPDFNEKILNANLVFRWEYLPGSTVYLVWTQARYGNSSTYLRNFSDNVSDAFKLPMDNVVLAKFSYWWSL